MICSYMAESFNFRMEQLTTTSALTLRASKKLDSLPLRQVYEAGIWRNRSNYFLNIAYPSMQAMESVDPAEVTRASAENNGRTVSLYIHVPFCTAECYYCHYYKQFGKSADQVDSYLVAVDQELDLQEKRFGGLETASIYIGGGTPSYLNSDQINQLFTTIEKYTSVPEDTEISFEVHPESVTDDRLAVLKSHGVNRINIGVESFNDIILKSENRRHTVEEARQAFEKVRTAGFDNVNLDLIYGLKGQTVEVWEETLDEVSRLQPASTTMYFLRLKRGTPEYRLWEANPQTFPSDQEMFLMHAMNFERMEGELGYLQNPVDWFIKDPMYFHTYQDHNWRRSDETELLGIGPSAYSYVDGWQYYNINDTGKWKSIIKSGELPIWKGEHLEGDEPMRRTVMLGIKMGMDRVGFADTYGFDVIEAFQETWDRLAMLDLVVITPDSVQLTYLGKLLADEVGATILF